MREPGGEESQPERERVREHVRRVGKQRQRPRRETGERFDTGKAEHEREDERQGSARAAVVPVVCINHARDGSEAPGKARLCFDMMPTGQLNGQFARWEG